MIASLIHVCGVIFYALFASGEKQYWAEPPDESNPDEGPSWNPLEHAFSTTTASDKQPNGDVTTSFSEVKQPTYGSTTSTIDMREELAQPPSTDPYMHGGIGARDL